MPKIIAFGHRKRVGKDTACRLLCSHMRINQLYSNIQVRGFADKGKSICCELFSWAGLQNADYYEIHQREKDIVLPALRMTPRDIWINFMSKARETYENIWVDYLFHNTIADILIIKDLRFPNEADRIHHYGGIVIKINRPDAPNDSDIADDALNNYTNWDHVIENDSNLIIFNQKIIALAESL